MGGVRDEWVPQELNLKPARAHLGLCELALVYAEHGAQHGAVKCALLHLGVVELVPKELALTRKRRRPARP